MDPTSFALVTAAKNLFDAAEIKRIRATEAELQDAWRIIEEYKPERVAHNLDHARTGHGPDGVQIPESSLAERLENLRVAQLAFDEHPVRLHSARAVETKCLAQLRDPARRVIEAAIVFVNSTLKDPPPVPAPAPFGTWGIPINLLELFAAPLRRAAADLAYEISIWGKQGPEVGFAFLVRANILETR